MPEPNQNTSGTPGQNDNANQSNAPVAGEPTGDNKIAPATYTIKVAGQSKTVTLEELTKLAELEGGADHKFKEAKKIEKEYAPWRRSAELVDKISKADEPDESDLRELAAIWKVDVRDLVSHISESTNATVDDGDTDTEDDLDKGDRKTKAKSRKVALDDLDEGIRDSVKYAERQRLDEAIKIVKGFCKKGVDTDEIIGKMVGKVGDTEKKKEILADMADYVFEDVQRRIALGEAYNDELVASCVQKARSHYGKFGIGALMAAGQPTPNMGFGLPPDLPADVLTGEPIKRVPSSSPNYVKNFVQRVFQMHQRGKGK